MKSPSGEQNRLYARVKASPPQPNPFTVPPKVNLVWHFWPVPGPWEWHVSRIRELLPTVDGLKLIGITTDETTVSSQEVIDRIGDSDV